MQKILKIFIGLFLLTNLVSCEMDFIPSDQISTESIPGSPDGLMNVTNGNYAMLKDGLVFNGVIDDNNCYVRQYFQMSNFASDDIVCGQTTEDPLYFSFTYTHSPGQSNARYFWYVSYKIINGANTVIEIANDIENKTAKENQILGENYFLRALSHFNLLRFYAKPYTYGTQNLGIIIRESTKEEAKKERATVGECYQFIISDLKKAASLMTIPRGNQYASKEAAWALLSRVYLYMNDDDNTIAYSDSVINSGRFTLETPTSFPDMFANATSHTEPIFVVAFIPEDNRGKFGSIASMIYSDGNSGWGEEFASQSYRDVLAENMNDVRWSFIDTLHDENGNISKHMGIEVFYITKFSFQDGDPNLSSPIMLRLAEMYLNRAEAYARKNDEAKALADVNEIRTNRGLAGDLYNSVPAGSSLLEVVLKERRKELAFEAQRNFDIFRNKQDLHRDYWGYHIKGLQISDIDLSTKPTGYEELLIPHTSPRVIYYIPNEEILANDKCEQNE
jgi:hypothetical protein